MVKIGEVFDSIKGVLPNMMDLGIGIATGVWFLTILDGPWSRHFSFKETRQRADECIDRGIKIDDEVHSELKSFETRTLISY
jgi:hypothetical protein